MSSERYSSQPYDRSIFYEKTKEATDLSNINLTITTNRGEIILYPRGEKQLDEELVNAVLTFLDERSNAHFKQALNFFQAKNAVKSAESLRRAIEEFLHQKLGNTKGLDTNIKEIQKKLKTEGTDPQVRNIIFQTLVYLDQYFNENSKHQDGSIDELENEFLIYQTGVLLRYIHQVQIS